MTEQETQTTKKEAKLIEVPTQMGTAIQLEDGTIVSPMELDVLIYNKLLKIEKAVV